MVSEGLIRAFINGSHGLGWKESVVAEGWEKDAVDLCLTRKQREGTVHMRTPGRLLVPFHSVPMVRARILGHCRAEAMAQLVKCLPCKREDLSLTFPSPGHAKH